MAAQRARDVDGRVRVDGVGADVAVPRARGGEHLAAADDRRPDAAGVARDPHQRPRPGRARAAAAGAHAECVARVGPELRHGRRARVPREPHAPRAAQLVARLVVRAVAPLERDGGGGDLRRAQSAGRLRSSSRRRDNDGQHDADEGLRPIARTLLPCGRCSLARSRYMQRTAPPGPDPPHAARRRRDARVHAGRHQGARSKALTPASSTRSAPQMVLGNTYHLHLRPGRGA